MDTFRTFQEDLASGRPAKKPVSSNLLKQRAKDNEKALKSGFMKMPDYAKKKFNEATADEVLKKRYASYNPDDNPQATRRLRDDEHDQPKGARVYKMHPGVKLTHRGYSKKGKMAALKKQHERRPEQYGITKESYAARIAEKIRKKIGIDIDVKPETVNEENLAPVTKEMESEQKTETPTTTEIKKTDSTQKEPQKEASIAETKVEKKLENPTEKK